MYGITLPDIYLPFTQKIKIQDNVLTYLDARSDSPRTGLISSLNLEIGGVTACDTGTGDPFYSAFFTPFLLQ